MLQVEITFPSEACTLLSFLFVDVILLSYVMHVSGLLAGHANHHILFRQQALHLRPFNMPIIGGSLITERGPRRSLFIFLRLSVVVAALLSNYGLEGRSKAPFKSKQVLVRVPGPLLEDDRSEPGVKRVVDLIYESTLYRMNCFELTEEGTVFGSVLNKSCYSDKKDDVFIKSFDFEPELVDTTATECKAQVDCRGFRTIFRCKQADMVCWGVNKFSKHCPGSTEQVDPMSKRNCHAVIYAQQGDRAWMCGRERTWPGKTGKRKEYCQAFEAKRENVERWVDYFGPWAEDQWTALFAAAYGTPNSTEMEVPEGKEEAVTIVNMFWFLPVAWVLTVAVVLSVWKSVHIVRGTPRVAHDEKGLSRLLDRQIKVRNEDVDMGSRRLERLGRRTVATTNIGVDHEVDLAAEPDVPSTIFIR